MSEIKIDNSIKNVITKGNWKDPGAKLYDDILKNTNWKDLLKEAYLVAPINDITNDPRVRTRLNSSGCKYPHHHIKDGKLVVSISGLRSAYICARNQGYFNNDSNNRPEYSRSVVTHLNRHCKELGIEPIWHHGELYFQDIKSKKFVEYTDINEFNEDSDEKLYRVTHNGIGIYEAMRQHMSLDQWKDFLKSDNATWLPKPDKYPDGYTSYFTKEGIDKFNELVYPIACGILGDNIKYEEFDQDDIGDIVYKDNYQIIAEYKEFTEKSHSNLKYAFRMAVNPHNGHFIKIIFDLDPDKVLQIGDHTQQSGRNKEKDEETRKNIRKNGSNDFSSIGLVKGIQDLDTKEQLKSVDTLGVIGASNQTRFSVPEELRDKRLGDEQYNMFSYPVKDREKIIKTLNLDNAKDIIKFTVGEVENVPSYKATLLSKSISGVYHNQFNPKGRGDQSKSKIYDQSIYAGLKSLKSRYKKVHDVLKDNDYYEDDFDYIEKLLNKLEEDVDKHSDEKYGQSTMHPRYSRRYSNIDSSISELEVEIKNMKKKKDSKVDKQINENFNIMYTIIQEQTGANLFDDNFEIFEESDKIDIVKEINYCMDMLNKTGDEKWLNKFKLAQKKLINESYAESSDIKKNDEFVPIFGILKKTSLDDKRNNGSEKDEYDKEMSKFQKQISTLTFGDNYAHALISFDDKFNHLYSFGDEGIEDDSIYLDSWMATDSIYICVMFVTKDERDKMKIYVDDMLAHPEKTSYAFSNLLKAYISKPAKIDKRFVCSTFTGFIMSCANPKNLNRDYSRLRPEDITILPRAFYVMNIKDREEFINRRSELINRVKAIYDEYHEELEDYNNHLPKLLLKDRVDKLKTSDKILDWIISKL